MPETKWGNNPIGNTKMTQDIQANFNNLVDNKEVKFNFRKVVDKETGIESKRDPLTLSLQVPSVEGLIAIIQAGGKQLELLQEAAAQIVVDRARELISEDEAVTPESFKYSELAWEVIANLPAATRKGSAISKETWEEFAADYIAVMPTAAGKTMQQVTNAAAVFVGKFAKAKGNKPVITKLVEQLAIYISNSQNADQFAEVTAYLTKRAEALLAADDVDALANL